MSIRKLPVLATAAAAALALSPALLAQSSYGGTSDKDKPAGMSNVSSDTTDTTRKTGMSDMGKVAGADKAFAIKAAKDGMAEVELGQLAADKASSDEVKSLAKKIVDDHTKANDELKTIATSKGITLPTETDRSHKAKMSKLQKLSGADFDKAFVSDLLKDHEKDMKLFDKEAKNGKDSDLKAFAQKISPALMEHHDSLDKVATSVGVKTGRKATLPAAGKTDSDMHKDMQH